MTRRYRMPLFAQSINLGSGRLDASPDGWLYPRTLNEENALIAAGAEADDTNSGGLPASVTVTPITVAELPVLTGVGGGIYELTDGNDAGAKLTWAVPSGESDPTWCWWLWPQSAYVF